MEGDMQLWFEEIKRRMMPMAVVVVVVAVAVVALVTSKKPKQKKVPQRGLGVAQLEKIRLEEQQKNEAAAAAAAAAATKPSSYMPHHFQNLNIHHSPNSPFGPSPAGLIQSLHHSNQPNAPIPLPCGSPADFRPPMDAKVPARCQPNSSPVPLHFGSSQADLIRSLHQSNQASSPNIPLPCGSPADFRPPMLLQHMMDAKVPAQTTAPLANCGEFQAGWHPGNVPKLCGAQEVDFEKERSAQVPYLPSLSFESNPAWLQPNLGQRTTQHHHLSSSMVNALPGTLSTASIPLPHFSIELPSNQNYSGSSVPVRPAEKMVGMKRPYPFYLDVPPVPNFNYKLPTFNETRMNATTRCGSGSGFNYDAGNSSVREVPSCSTSNSEPNSRKSNKESESFNGDFLSLAPPTPTSCSPSNLKSCSAFLAFHNQQNPGIESPSCQGVIEDRVPPQSGHNRLNQQKQPFYCFFPPAAAEDSPIGQTTARTRNGNEARESVDLNLKL